MRFDWVTFLRRNHIRFIRDGKNVKRGHVNIPCPFCGSADKSEHMGIDPKSGAWACWRNSEHRSKYPERLIVALKGCTWDEAKALANDDTLVAEVGYDALATSARNLFGIKRSEQVRLKIVEFDESISAIGPDAYRRSFVEYIVSRGFLHEDVRQVVARYGLLCSIHGAWKSRLIMPLFVGDKLVGWTGRAIGNGEPKYLSYPDETVKQLVYNQDRAQKGGPILVIVEGPIDTIKIDYYGHTLGVTAIGLLGVSTTETQLNTVARLAARFDVVVSLLDDDALAQSLRLSARLASPVLVKQMMEGIHDPGDMTPEQIDVFVKSIS